MKKVGNHNSNSRKLFLSSFNAGCFLNFFAQDATQQPQLRLQQLLKVVTRGKELLMQIVLHVISDAKSTGPMLRGIAGKHDMPWLYSGFITALN
jgi:hypothetical protein